MRITLRAVGVALGLLAVAFAAPAVHAQAPGRPFFGYGSYHAGPRAQPVVLFAVVPAVTSLSVQTSASIPDGGTVTLGGYSRASASRSEYGVPGLGKLPYAGRGFRNTASGREITASRVTATVRVISLRDEEYRQTGFRSP